MSRSLGRPSALALAAVLAVTLTGCPNQDLDGADAANVLTDAGASEDVATCLGDRFDDDLSQGQINDVGGADELSELDNELQEEVETILAECVGGSSEGSGDSVEDQGSGEPSDGDSSDTTEADAGDTGDETTTTAGE
jgi:hypothetical protein